MTMTEFAMVEELASLIKDNLFTKHLVLSTEETIVNFLQDDTSPEVVLELEPMSPYHRLLLHRLAEIYGLAHVSVGEGDDRHLVLERCPETTIPSILVSDILWQYDEYQSPTSPQHILRRKKYPATTTTEALPSSAPLKEREAAYLAARDRIFSLHKANEKEAVAPKSRNVPVVARRMIAHALGQKLSESSNERLSPEFEMAEVANNGDRQDDHVSPTLEATRKKSGFPTMKPSSRERPGGKASSCDGISCNERKAHSKAGSSSSVDGNLLANESNSSVVGIESLEREQRGAAKRIFAHALGLSSKGNHATPMKSSGGNRWKE